ncbi:sugar-transfer associated ATP-grasp domain-containing protein [Bowmanella dokdonensis]|uniref:Alpha-L-glutamate ligase-related protein ATP-grasp domain-containing protein n=1 Tax=Bowmanella dokdonensis TaxID=751969 RepID=A0A939IT16_9ALTE|nr:sugar-transfer associated ATP-grasp domain-containing protein [Bowmanella dokdonensis]MBN7827312.1 hypothetical protein [Bowmanella dokdonensis]
MASIVSKLRTTLSMLRTEARLAGVPFASVLLDCCRFCLKTKLGPRYFVVAGMARKDFPAEKMWLHVSAREYYQALETLNPKPYRKLTQSKLSEKAIYAFLHIRSAQMLGYFHPRRGIDRQGNPLKTEETLQQLLAGLEGQKICVKPIEGWGGQGIKVLLVAGTADHVILQETVSGKELSVSALMDTLKDPEGVSEFIIEDFIEQTPQFAAFNPSSVNTLRLWVLEARGQAPQVIGAYLRVGRQGAAVDNASAGGIMCPVNLATGVTEAGLTKYNPHRGQLTHHPDHGAQLSGVQLMEWSAICQFACEVLAKLPNTRFAGLDITLSEQGPVLVETNVSPDKDGAAHANIPSIKLVQAAAELA